MHKENVKDVASAGRDAAHYMGIREQSKSHVHY